MGILGDRGPGVVVGRQDGSGCDQGDGFEAVLGAHGKQIADGDDQAIDPVACDPFHIPEDGGIASVVDAIGLAGRSMDFDDPSSGGPAIGTVGETRGVDGGDEHHATKLGLQGSPMVHADGVFDVVFVAEPLSDLEIGEHLSAGALGDRRGVGDVVGVRVRDENVRGGQIRSLRPGRGVVIQERVDQDAGRADFQPPCGMSIPYSSDL